MDVLNDVHKHLPTEPLAWAAGVVASVAVYSVLKRGCSPSEMCNRHTWALYWNTPWDLFEKWAAEVRHLCETFNRFSRLNEPHLDLLCTLTYRLS
eukprot:2775187-Pyramimonas_sp.AAC.1